RYLQVRRQHDRRLWIGTIVSCVVSALVGGGLVSFLQKPPMPDPPLLAATLSSELNRDQHDHVVCTSDVAWSPTAAKLRIKTASSLRLSARLSRFLNRG